MKTILITGGTGTIGKALTSALLAKGYNLIVFTRKPHKYKPAERLQYVQWDPEKEIIDESAIRKGHAVLHLAGAGVADKRWTDKRKRIIRDSRVKGGELLSKSLAAIPNDIAVVVSASAIGWYGPDPQIPNSRPFKESDPANTDFLGATCEAWENSLAPVADLGKRLVFLRTGIVLAKEGGALAEFIKPVKFGIATIMSTGKQMVSWIHLDDIVRLYIEALENDTIRGAYNAVAPNPVTNKELVLELARKMRGNLFIPIHVPGIFLKIGLGEMSIEVLKSTTVSASKIKSTGFQFVYPTLNSALQSLIASEPGNG